MTPRKKLPAYGAALMKLRRSGERVRCVHLIYGNEWKAAVECMWPKLEGPHPTLALKPEDYAPGVFDFSCVVGVHVALFDQVRGADEFKDPVRPTHPVPHAFGKFYALAGELAAWAARVDIHSPVFGALAFSAETMASAARDWRHAHDPSLNHGWPAFWSDDIEAQHEQRRITWLGAVGELLERRPARVDDAERR